MPHRCRVNLRLLVLAAVLAPACGGPHATENVLLLPELGPAAFGRVVVTSGLEDGDIVALRDPTATKDRNGKNQDPSGPVLPGGAS